MVMLQSPHHHHHHHHTCLMQNTLFSSFLTCCFHQSQLFRPSFPRLGWSLEVHKASSATSTVFLTPNRKHSVIASSSGDDRERITALPFRVSTSLRIESWGSIYTGPNDISKYWNSSKDHPYPVDFISVKVYKGNKFKQTIQEGPAHGPLFVIEDENGNIFTSYTPQKVWNKVTAKDGVQVHGARHFGFQSPVVVRTLQRMAHHSKIPVSDPKDPLYRMDVDMVTNEEDLSKNSIAFDNIDKNFSVREWDNVQLDNAIEGRDDDNAEGYDGATSAKDADELVDGNEGRHAYQDDDNDDIENDMDDCDSDDDNADDFVSGLVMNDYEIDAQDDDNEIMNLVEEEEDDDDDNKNVIALKGEEDDGHPDIQDGLSFSSFNLHSLQGRTSVEENDEKAGSVLSTPHKRSFRAGPRKFTFRIAQSTANNHVEKHDPRFQMQGSIDRNVMNHPSNNASKTKLMGSVDKQVWKRGEGLTNQGGGGIGKYGAETYVGEQWSSNEARNPSSSNNSIGNRTWEASVSKRKEEHAKNSHMLLDLLQKWSTINKLSQDPDSKCAGTGEKDSVRSSDNITKEHNRSSLSKYFYQDPFMDVSSVAPNSRHEQFPVSGSSGHRRSVLSDLWNHSNINESTNFAIRKLFETVRKDQDKSPPNVRKSVVQVNNPFSSEYINHENEFLDQSSEIETHRSDKHIETIDSCHDLQNLLQGEPRPSSFQRNKELFETERKTDPKPAQFSGRIAELSEEKHKISQRGVEETKRIAELRNLITNKRFVDGLQALRSMKLSGITIDEDIYEVLMGFKLDPWQKQVFRHVHEGNSVLISAPSGAGKSAVVECCIYRSIIDQKRLLFVTPSEHLAAEKLEKYGGLFGRNNVGGIWTKMRVQKGPQLVVITLETLAKILQELNGPGGSEFRFFFEGIDTVIFDKFHTFSEISYASLWEEVLMLLDSRIKIIAISLPVENEDQTASWIDMNHGPCTLVSSTSNAIPKRYFFCHSSKLLPLLDPKGIELNSSLSDPNEGLTHPLVGKNLASFLSCGYDRSSMNHVLSAADVNGMLPAIVVFFRVEDCSNAMVDAIAAVRKGLLSQSEAHKMENLLAELRQSHYDIVNHLDIVELQGLHKGLATYHEAQFPVWQEFIKKLVQEDLLKVLIITEISLLHTEFLTRSIIMPAINRVTKNGVSSIPRANFMDLIGRAGRRGYDTEGNVIFLKNLHSEPNEAADLVLNNSFSIDSCFKPSYSLVLNLMAKHNLSDVKKILGRTFANFQFHTKQLKSRKLAELDKMVLDCLEAKASLEAKLYQGLTEVNRKKLSDAAIFTRLDIRMTIHSASENGNAFPGMLLAVVPGQTETFYMVFGADNNFRLLPAGAFDHVYAKEVSPLDSVYKEATGKTLQPPLIPTKDKWIVEQNGSYGYVSSGNLQTKEFVRLLMEHPAQPMVVKEGPELRKEILRLEAQILDLMERRRKLQLKKNDIVMKLDTMDQTEAKFADSDIWKEALRLLKVLEKADTFSIIDTHGAYIKLKPLGMLISRLHNAENELWLAAVVASNHVKQLSPSEFIGLLAMMVSLDPEVENLFSDQRELLYRVPKALKDAFVNLTVLRNEIAALQGSYDPPLHFDTTLAGMVYAWARGKPGTNGFSLVKTNVDGAVARKLRVIARFANLIYEACTQVSVDISEPSDFINLSSLARRAEELVTRYLIAVE